MAIEIAAIQLKLDPERHGDRVRLSWTKWNIEAPNLDEEWLDWEGFEWWRLHCWQEAYHVADQLAGHKLSEWQDSVRAAAAGQHMGKISCWIGGASPPKAAWDGDEAVVDQDDFVEIMRREWGSILTPPQPCEGMH